MWCFVSVDAGNAGYIIANWNVYTVFYIYTSPFVTYCGISIQLVPYCSSANKFYNVFIYSQNLLSRISRMSLYLEWLSMPKLLSIHLYIIKLMLICMYLIRIFCLDIVYISCTIIYFHYSWNERCGEPGQTAGKMAETQRAHHDGRRQFSPPPEAIHQPRAQRGDPRGGG